MLGIAGAIESKVLLQRFLDTDSETTADSLLDRLMNRHAAPIIRGVIARRAGFARHGHKPDEIEAEQIHSLAVMEIVAHLRQARDGGKRDAIRHFKAYVTLMTERAFGEFLDEKNPERRRLKQRLRYLLKHQPGLAAWLNRDGRTVCGLADWQSKGIAPVSSERSRRLRDNPFSAAAEAMPQSGAQPDLHEAASFPRKREPARSQLAPLTCALLRWVGHPVELEEMVNCVAQIQGIGEPPTQAAQVEDETEEAADPYENVADPETDVERAVERREFLQRLWVEIGRLPVRQRAALLLNMRDTSGISTLDLFVLTRIARHREIAAALEMPWEQFAGLWAELPLDDKRIAALLGISVENVRYQRFAARARLQERVAAAA
jgi:RNA polymerase sigma factor (sigma-70 family)